MSKKIFERLVTLAAAVVALAPGCDSSGPGTSGETHFISCKENADCASLGPDYACVDHVCAASAERALSDGILGDWIAAPGATQQPTAVSFRADHSLEETVLIEPIGVPDSGTVGSVKQKGTWQLNGTLLDLTTVDCGSDPSPDGGSCVPRTIRLRATIEGDTLGLHFGGDSAVWWFVRKP